VRLGEKIVAASFNRFDAVAGIVERRQKTTGIRAVRGSRLIRRQTSKPVDRSSHPRSPAGIDTSRMQRSGWWRAAAASADGPSSAEIVR